MNSDDNSGENSTFQMESHPSPISIQQLIQNAIKTVEDLTELDRQVVSREIVEDLEAKLLVAEAKIAALQSDLDAKEDERKLYYEKFKQYGRENRELKKKLAEMETNRTSKSSQYKKTVKNKVTSQTSETTKTASTSQVPPKDHVATKFSISIATNKLRDILEQQIQPTVKASTSQAPPSASQAKPKSSGMTSKNKRRSSNELLKTQVAQSDKDDSLDSSPRKKLCQKLFGSFSSKDTSSSSSSESSSSSDSSDSSDSDDENPPALAPEVKIENIENNDSNTIENTPSSSSAYFLEHRSPTPPTNPTGFVCRLCEPRFRPSPFKTIDHYRIHIKHVHFQHEQPYFCRLCPYHSSKKSDVKRHEGIHKVGDTEASYTCEICSAPFTNKKGLSFHCNTYHP